MYLIGMIIKIVGSLIFLYYRLSWMSLILIFLRGLIILFQILVGKSASNILKEINVEKDQRMKVYTELVEGIKVIKLYGWELAFNRLLLDVSY